MLAPYDRRRDRDGSWIVFASMIGLDYPGSSCSIWELLNLQDGMAPGGKHLQRRAEAEARVANAVRAVVRQRNIATALRRRNMNASDAEARLAQLERKLSDFEQQLASIINEQANN